MWYSLDIGPHPLWYFEYYMLIYGLVDFLMHTHVYILDTPLHNISVVFKSWRRTVVDLYVYGTSHIFSWIIVLWISGQLYSRLMLLWKGAWVPIWPLEYIGLTVNPGYYQRVTLFMQGHTTLKGAKWHCSRPLGKIVPGR